ncbi:MAG: hypothetical protein ACI93N_001586 [Flavobacteriaceae bacterium]|jgi:hypothetical protein
MGSKKLIKDKGRKVAIYKGAKCLNCGHPLKLTDKFCSNCSQINSTKQLSIKDFLDEFFSSMFTYDSRLRYTLKDLLFKPGTITKNYVAGQRLKYANPFRFFLSVSIIYFLIQGLSTSLGFNNDTSIVNINGKNINASTNLDSLINQIPANQKDALVSDSLKTKLDSIIKKNNIKIEPEKENSDINKTYFSEAVLDEISWDDSYLHRLLLYRKFYKNTKIKNPETALDSLKHPNTSVNKWLYSKNDFIERVSENPWGFANYLIAKIPFFLFFFAPVFALIFWILYSRKKYNYMEHLVFIFHIFSFVFLASLILYIPDLLIGDSGVLLAIILVFIGPIYFYKALRNFYNQSRLLTIFKFIVLNLVFFVGSTISALLFFSVSAAMY